MNDDPPRQNNLGQIDVPDLGMGCRWGADLAAASKALAAYFERLAEYQLEATNEMARVAKDPSRAAEAYSTYMQRLTQMYAEMQGALEKMMREAQWLAGSIYSGGTGPWPTGGPGTFGTPLVPSLKYGQAASQNPSGPGDWRFDPGQSLPPANAPFGPSAVAEPATGSTSLPFYSRSTSPLVPPLSVFKTAPSSFELGPASDPSVDKDVLAARAELREQRLVPSSLRPAAPQVGYPMPRDCAAETSGVKYRCDGYRRVARAKL